MSEYEGKEEKLKVESGTVRRKLGRMWSLKTRIHK